MKLLKNKLFWGIVLTIVSVLMFGVFAAIFFFPGEPLPIDISRLNAFYVNDSRSFTFQYPNGWFVTDSTEETDTVLIYSHKELASVTYPTKPDHVIAKLQIVHIQNAPDLDQLMQDQGAAYVKNFNAGNRPGAYTSALLDDKYYLNWILVRLNIDTYASLTYTVLEANQADHLPVLAGIVTTIKWSP